MVEKSAQGRWADWQAALEDALTDVRQMLAAGEPQEAERRAKAVSAFAKAIRDTVELAAYGRDQAPEDDAEALRAELRRRVARVIEADRAGADLETLERIGAGAAP